MKPTHKIHNIAKAIVAISAGVGMAFATSCSDNVAQGLYADSDSHISLSVSADGFSNGLLTIGSAQSSTLFNVISTTRWTVDVTDCEGSWCQIIYGNGDGITSDHVGDGSFLIDTAPNRSSNSRECNVTVYAVDSEGNKVPGQSVLIHLTQDRQSIRVDYAGDVISPLGTSLATEPQVTVTANQAWTASTTHSWVTIIPGSGMEGNGFSPEAGSSDEKSVSFRFSVEGNPGTSVRNAEITISSPTQAFTPIRLNVTQEGSSDTFFLTPTDLPEISCAGSSIEFQVYSPREAWTVTAVSAGDWIELDRTSGEASGEAVTITAKVAINSEHEARQGAIIFTRGGNMGESVVTINQKGDPEKPATPDPEYMPVVSEAWIVGGWMQTWAQIRAYYSSPSIEITGCGAFVHPVNDEDNLQNVKGSLGDNNLIMVDFDSLTPNTSYKAWCYVEFTLNGQPMVAAGGAVYFSTPDKSGQPGAGDNTPPSVN